MRLNRRNNRSGHLLFRRSLGLSLVELLLSLAITAMLLTATMLAINASFKAYASASESASTQTSTRLVVHRLLALLRTSTAHGPLEPDSQMIPPVALSGTTLTSPYLELIDSKGNLIRLEYVSPDQMLYVTTTPLGSAVATRTPLLGGVTSCQFQLKRRLDRDGVWVLERGTLDCVVEADASASLAIEADRSDPIRVVASTMPRQLDSD